MRCDRLPLGPLLRAAQTSMSELARRTGEHRRQLQRWKTAGVDWREADRLAFAVGWHPLEVWGECWVWVQPFPEDEPDGRFGGRDGWYRASGAADWYGDPLAEPLRVALRAGVAA